MSCLHSCHHLSCEAAIPDVILEETPSVRYQIALSEIFKFMIIKTGEMMTITKLLPQCFRFSSHSVEKKQTRPPVL